LHRAEATRYRDVVDFVAGFDRRRDGLPSLKV
jgi:hypothetical protein